MIAAGESKVASEAAFGTDACAATECELEAVAESGPEHAAEVGLVAGCRSGLGPEPLRVPELESAAEPEPEFADGPEESQVTLAMTVSYKGAPFCGFARQPGQLTVQGSIEEALATLFAQPVETVCAGRTDAGVHAVGQVVSFAVSRSALRDRTMESIRRALNALTHDDIGISEVHVAPDGFSARFDAVEREYRYYICTDPCPPLVMRDFCWLISKPLDVEAMEQASRCLIGEHDFKSFCLAASAKGKPTCRNVSRIDFERTQIMGANMVVITVVGNAFLHNMVRTIVGTLALVGRHQREIEWVQQALDACDRRAAGQNAPAQGLIFWEVRYNR